MIGFQKLNRLLTEVYDRLPAPAPRIQRLAP